MTKHEFNRVFELANTNTDFSKVDTEVLFGCGLPDFQPVTCTIQCAAAFIRWQALQLNGEWDSVALNECRQIFRNKVRIA
jgi:hypothetical protein